MFADMSSPEEIISATLLSNQQAAIEKKGFRDYIIQIYEC